MPAHKTPDFCSGCSKIKDFLTDIERNTNGLETVYWIDMILQSLDRERIFLLNRRDQILLPMVGLGKIKDPDFVVKEEGPYKYTVVRRV